MTKLEEVARAICCPKGCRWPNACEGDEWEPEARAAITALEEPSDGMVVVAAKSVYPEAELWDAMRLFKAALNACLDEAKAEGES